MRSRSVLSSRLLAAFVLLTGPAASFIHAQSASPSAVRADTIPKATITGVVVDSGGAPVAGATVRVPSGSPSTRTDSAGAFRLAGVPAGNARVQVLRDGYTPLGFEFEIAANVTVSLRLTLLPAPPAPVVVEPAAEAAPSPTDSVLAKLVAEDSVRSKGSSRTSSIVGVVIDSAGRAVFGATVQAMSTELRSLSDSAGRFRIPNVPTGLTFLRIRKIGYLSEYLPLQVEEGRVAALSVKLRPASGAPSLARVEVRADARGDAKMAGFYERSRKASGVFVTREELLRRNVSNVTEVLRGRTGVNIIRDGNGIPVVFGRNLTGAGYCAMGVLIDGTYVNSSGIGLDRLISTQDVRAIEVYRSGPSVPSEFQRRETDCGAVIIWTR